MQITALYARSIVWSRETKKNAHGALSWRLKVVNLSMIEKDFNWIPTIDWIRSDLGKEEKRRIKGKRRAEGKGQEKKRTRAKECRCLITWSSSEKHFIIARSLYLKNAYRGLVVRFPRWQHVVFRWLSKWWDFTNECLSDQKANFTAAAFRCMYHILSGSDLKNDPARQCDAKEIETYSHRAAISRGVPLDDSKVQLIFFNLFV